jgi:hypothetical protein
MLQYVPDKTRSVRWPGLFASAVHDWYPATLDHHGRQKIPDEIIRNFHMLPSVLPRTGAARGGDQFPPGLGGRGRETCDAEPSRQMTSATYATRDQVTTVTPGANERD